MKSITLLLAVCSFVFASSTVYLMTRAQPTELSAASQKQCLDSPARAGSAPSKSDRVPVPDAPKPSDIALVYPTAHDEPNARQINLAMAMSLDNEQRQLLMDPNYRVARLEVEKQHLWEAHRETIGALNLSAESAEGLVTLLAEHRIQSLERPVGAPSGDEVRVDPSNPPGWLVEQRLEEQRRQADIRALLGDAKYAEWAAYHETSMARREVALLGREFELSGDPLRPEQREALTRMILDEERRQLAAATRAQGASVLEPLDGFGHVASLEENVKRIEQSNDRLQRGAGKHLSTQQMQLYDAVLDRRLRLAEAQLHVQREMIEQRATSMTQDQ